MNVRGVFVRSLAVVLLLVLKQSDCSCIYGDVRLTGGLGDYEGNVQVCINGTWGYICHHNWFGNDAQVVCRQLNYSTTGAIYRSNSHYGYGNGTLWMDDVNCVGSETKLLDCPRKHSLGYVPTYCSYKEVAGVVCPYGGSGCTDGGIRLVNSNLYSIDGVGRSEGRVEVCSNNEWVTVCGNGWDSNDATVACKQLGYNGYIDYYTYNYYGGGSGSIWLTDLGCSSSDTSLFDCPHSTADTSDCTHSNDTGVKCYSIDSSSCTHGDVKLWSAYESTPDNEGIPLVCMNGTWYPIHYTSYCRAFVLACKAMGYTGLYLYRYNSGTYYGYYYQDHYKFTCSAGSTFSSLFDCPYTSNDYSNSWDKSVGVKCYHKTTTTGDCSVEGSVRLVGGVTANEGRVEYCYNNEWAPACYIDEYTSDAVCKSLGYRSNISVYFKKNEFGKSPYWSDFNYLSCKPSDNSLSQCTVFKKCSTTCSTFYGVRCYELTKECTDSDVRLVNGIIEQEGRPEVCVNGLWSQICDSGWDANDARVMCLSLGYNGSADPTAFLNSKFGAGYGPIVWRYVNCGHGNNDIFDCKKMVYPSFDCVYSNIAGVRCTEGCSDGDIRLVGGASVNEGTVEVCYDELWGLISDDGWSDNEAIVVCRQLGYNGENAAVVGSYYGKPNKTIHLKDVTCSSLETNILSCNVHQLSLSDGKALLPITDVAGVDCKDATTPHSSPTSSNIPTPERKSSISTGLIIAIVMGSILALAIGAVILVVIIVCCVRRQKSGSVSLGVSYLSRSTNASNSSNSSYMRVPNTDD